MKPSHDPPSSLPFLTWQDFRKTVAIVAALILAGDLVINRDLPEYSDVKSSHSKITQELASMGMSRQDLPTELRQRIDNLLATGDPEKAAEENKSKKRKNQGEDKEKAPKKAAKAAASDKKRKKA